MDGESRASRNRLLRKSSRFDIVIIYRIFPGKPASLIQKWSDHITSFHMNLSNREVATVSHESYPVVTSHWYPNWHVGRWLSGRGGFVQVPPFLSPKRCRGRKPANNVLRWRRNFHTCALLNVQNTIITMSACTAPSMLVTSISNLAIFSVWWIQSTLAITMYRVKSL